jgi:hypothetical protein
MNDSDENSILNEIDISNNNKYQGKNRTKLNHINNQITTKIYKDSRSNINRKSVDFFLNKNSNHLMDNYEIENFNIRSIENNNSFSNNILFSNFF